MTKPIKLLQPKTTEKTDLENAFNPFTLIFKDKVVEFAFIQNYFQNSKVSLRFGVAYTFVLIIAQLCLTYFFVGNSPISNILIGFYCLYGFALIRKSYSKNFALYMQSLTCFYALALAFWSGLSFWQFQSSNFALINYIAFNSILLVIFYTFMRLRFVYTLFTNLLITGVFAGLIYKASPQNIIFIAVYLGLINLFGLLLSHRLEYYAKRQFLLTKELSAENERSDELLLNILPESVAQRLKNKEEYIVDEFNSVSILFCDICGFTPLSAKIPAKKLVGMLNEMFCAFDEIAQKYDIEKIKTMGDCYMAVAGIPLITIDHAYKMANMALDIKEFVQNFNQNLNVRIGINSGPVIAGVIGTKKFIYDLWGNSVNVAARMESHSLNGEIQITQDTYDLIKNDFNCEYRGEIEVKGKGKMRTYFLKSRKNIDNFKSLDFNF